MQSINPRNITRAKAASAVVGGVFYCLKTGRILLGKRSGKGCHPHTFSPFGGHIENLETPSQALQRELGEETKWLKPLHLRFVGISDEGSKHHTLYVVLVQNEFVPILDHEHDGYLWCTVKTLPSPLHPMFSASIPDLTKVLASIRLNRDAQSRIYAKYFLVQSRDRFFEPYDDGREDEKAGGYERGFDDENEEEDDDIPD